MFSLVRSPLPASAVDHSLSCRLLSPSEPCLVTAGADVLRVFRLKPHVGVNLDDLSDSSAPPKMRLECVLSWRLHGAVQGLQKVCLSGGGGRDALVLTFLDAKLSVVEYDPDAHDLKTISMHVFEDEDMRGGFASSHSVPLVAVDPDNRCAAMLVFGKKIVIIPFRGEGATNMSDTIDDLELDGVKPSSSSSSSRILPSYVLDLKQVIMTNVVDNILDLQFLHGYNQPTLLLLYEPIKTFPGRIAVRKDTYRMDVLTLDVKERISAFIWSKENLPFDCHRALPVPKPIGGVLVFSTNALHYLNQGIPPYAVSVNAIGDDTLDNLNRQNDVRIALDCSVAEFIAPERAVISLKGGELYVLTLLVDGLRSVRGFHLDRAAASVLTCCLASLAGRYLFLGSRLGNSLLLQFTEKDIGMPGAMAAYRQSLASPPSKRKKVGKSSGLADWMASDVDNVHEDDLEVYGGHAVNAAALSTTRVATYAFEVCDSLLNIGPCGQVSMGEPAFLSEELSSSTRADPDVELVTTSGHGKNGALCVLQQSVRPQVVTTFELPGCRDMWTVTGGDGGGDDAKSEHAFLILSRPDSTMVLQTGQEINELERSGFATSAPTVLCGNVGGDSGLIVQVCQRSARLLRGSELLQEVDLQLREEVARASLVDPHVLVVSAGGEIALLSLEEDPAPPPSQAGGRRSRRLEQSAEGGNPRLSLLKANLKRAEGNDVEAVCVYKDVSGLLTVDMGEDLPLDETQSKLSSKLGSSSSVGGNAAANDIEDEDALLYGDAAPAQSQKSSSSSCRKGEPFWRKHLRKVDPTYWAVMLRRDSTLEILSLPDFVLRFAVKDFKMARDVLIDSSASGVAESMNVDHTIKVPSVTEVLLVGLGSSGRRPVLLARTQDHELLAYEAFPHPALDCGAERLRMRFKKMRHGIILRERKGKSKKDLLPTPRSSLRPFRDIAGYEGVFVCGPYPHWLLLTARGELRRHPMHVDGAVACFAPFHNVNCPNGFLYFNKKGELRICVLPTHLSYDAPWPVRKVPLRCTPHFVTYHLESKTYAVVTSASEQTDKVWKFNGDDKELVSEERDAARFPWPSKDSFTLQLFSPVSWEPIPGAALPLNDWERCTNMKHLYLSSEGLHSGQRGYIVLSTSYCYGEDVTPRGLIRIYDVIEVIPEPGQPLTKNKIKTVYDKEQKGPVTSVAAVNGYLVATVGQKIYIFQFKNKDLFGVAFIDSQIYIHQLVTLKNFILAGDVIKSVDLLVFQKDYRTLAVISRDPRDAEIFACEFAVDGPHLAAVATDADRNLVVFAYQPEARESQGGQKLVRRGDFQLGQQVNCMWRIRARITDPSTGGRVITGWEKRHVTWFATLDGALGYVLPCAEKTFRRMQMVANVLNQSLCHVAGLNPKSFRTFRQHRRELLNPSRGVSDGDLVFRFADLPVREKWEVARRIGAPSPEDLLDEMAELDRMAAHF